MKSYVQIVKQGPEYRYHKRVRGRNPVAAAKKLYRENKSLPRVYVGDMESGLVYAFETSSFFTLKKPHKMRRRVRPHVEDFINEGYPTVGAEARHG